MILFLAATPNLLEWKIFAEFANTVVDYLLKILMDQLVVVVGFILGGVVQKSVLTVANSTNFNHASAGLPSGFSTAIACSVGVYIWSQSTGVAQVIAFVGGYAFLGIATVLSAYLFRYLSENLSKRQKLHFGRDEPHRHHE